ncbi:MAG: hypothetical protein NT001_01415 [Candidatus Woesearchaeota archaeon]|nr:hypothetical protein [Candidatus Woesearchaeota archaeon]
MGKRGDFFVLILVSAMLCCPAAVFGWQSDASINTASIYETNSADFTITVANSQDSRESINNISVATSGFSIDDVKDSSGWHNVVDASNANLLDWNIFIPNGFDWIQYIPFIDLGISSDAAQNFRFNAKALKVDKDEAYDWPVTSIFHDKSADTKTIRVTVLNDYTGPELSGWNPSDRIFIKKGTKDLPAGIDAVDPETGVSQVFFNYVDCAQASNASAKTSINLAKDLERYSSIADVSRYDDSINVCFSFIAENNGGALSNYSGRFTIDGIAPVVELIAPEDNALMNALSEFIFVSTDNLAPETYCKVYSDGNVSATMTALKGENTTVNVSGMPEGNHTWSVSCDDPAGWTGYSLETRDYILDKTPPTIIMNTPGNGAIIKAGTAVEINVADNIRLKDVYYTLNGEGMIVNDTPIPADSFITLDTTDWEEGDKIITVTATDAAGNAAVENLVVIIDKTAPAVNLTAPESGGSYDYHIQYVFNTKDNYDKMIDCVLYIDNEAAANETVNTSDSSAGVINFITKLGYHEWYVACTDDASNSRSSDVWNVTTIDTTGPDVAVNKLATVVRGRESAMINATLHDISGIDTTSVYADIADPNGVRYNISLSPVSDQNGDYIGAFLTNAASPLGEYSLTVYAKDSNGNPSSASGSFNVTYGYVVLMTLDPSNVNTGQDVTVTGSVKKDDDSLVPDSSIGITLPDSTASAGIDPSTGGFTYVFSYGTGGVYNISATITPENGFTFGDSEMLTVNAPDSAAADSSTDSTGTDSDISTSGCAIINRCYEDGKCVECATDNSKDDAPIVSEPDQSDMAGNSDTNTNDSIINNAGNESQSDDGMIISGKSISFFNMGMLKSEMFWWVVLMLLSIISVLTYMKKRGLPGFSKEDELGLDDYLDKRNRE